MFSHVQLKLLPEYTVVHWITYCSRTFAKFANKKNPLHNEDFQLCFVGLKDVQLEIWGRAQHEAARSSWTYPESYMWNFKPILNVRP